MAFRYGGDLHKAVLANANRGGEKPLNSFVINITLIPTPTLISGENVHSGIVMGAAIGAATGASQIPADLKEGLSDSAKIKDEIQRFTDAIATAGARL